ncbi:chromatin remodeling complex subunit [Ascodesmis nigricans]|uniref:Chromatin remodeling complex subunit n=1 Tax=Ascodesmis nigricans TaxID=341454 RepID=A0A4V3SHP9_9PEZI|nr:chromatin remodeling complex subunit [Ascodesmis nigricans]
MPPKKSGRALAREEGLERTDNRLPQNSWPLVTMINQKNYYTEYLKRDDQIMVLREQGEEALRQQAIQLEKQKRVDQMSLDPAAILSRDADVDGDGEKEDGDEDENEEEAVERRGAKVIVIHPGSQNLRLGFASDVVPKSMPFVIARRGETPEYLTEEQSPKRVKLDDDGDTPMGDADQSVVAPVEKPPEWDAAVVTMSKELKDRMRGNKRRMLPNSKDLVLSFNRKHTPERISVHNDINRAEWTDVSTDPQEFYVGMDALRIPDDSNPAYRSHWPIRYGGFNEKDQRYKSKRRLLEDIDCIITEGIKKELGLERKQLRDYRAVLVIPDLYEKNYVIEMVDMFMKEIRFAEVCIMQESVAASYGAGWSLGCIIDVGAQKTSICCVEEGVCVAESRINLKFGGYDITESLLRMLLVNDFPYKEANLMRRQHFLEFEDLKSRIITLNDSDVTLSTHEFFIRSPGTDTLKYSFRTYDEIFLAAMSFYRPTIVPHTHKFIGRRSVWDRSYDIYDNTPNDPMSTAQAAIYQSLSSSLANNTIESTATTLPSLTSTTEATSSTPARPIPSFPHLNPPPAETPRSSNMGSPGPETATPNPDGATPSQADTSAPQPEGLTPSQILLRMWSEYDRTVPIAPLDSAVIDSITHAAKGDDKKIRDFLRAIMIVGGGAEIASFTNVLQEMVMARDKCPKDAEVVVAVPPRDIGGKECVWKGASVFGKLSVTNDSWMKQKDYDMLGSRLLTVKTIWNF